MLRAAGILARGDLKAIERGLSRSRENIEAGRFRGQAEARTYT